MSAPYRAHMLPPVVCPPAQALSSSYKASGSELSLQHLASEVQSRLLAADALVRKYGHERLLSSLLRLEGREEVEKKFDGTIRELQSVTSKVGSTPCLDWFVTAGSEVGGSSHQQLMCAAAAYAVSTTTL